MVEGKVPMLLPGVGREEGDWRASLCILFGIQEFWLHTGSQVPTAAEEPQMGWGLGESGVLTCGCFPQANRTCPICRADASEVPREAE